MTNSELRASNRIIIGLLVAILGVSLASPLAVIAVMVHLLEARTGPLGARMGALEARMSSLEVRMGALATRMGALEVRMGALEVRMGAVENGLLEVKERVYAVEKKVDVMWDAIGMEQETLHEHGSPGNQRLLKPVTQRKGAAGNGGPAGGDSGP